MDPAPAAWRAEQLGIHLIGTYLISRQDYLDDGIEIPRTFDKISLKDCRQFLSQHGSSCDDGEVTACGSRKVKLWRQRQDIF